MNPLTSIFKGIHWLKCEYLWRNYKADLGFTLSEAIQKYGDSTGMHGVDTPFPEHDFDHLDIETGLVIYSGRAICVMHSSDKPFSDDFITSELELASAGRSWYPYENIEQKISEVSAVYLRPNIRFMMREDEQVWAYFYSTSKADPERFYFNIIAGKWNRVNKKRYPKI